ncbi:MAG: SRPBCC family protein [Myxococcaceae bacterium]|nr:SRPBCC family protein [Myxococcaceae bacterium]
MPKWLKVVAAVIGGLLLAAGGLGALLASQPSSYRLSRVRTIPVSSEVIRPLITDLRAHDRWMKHFADPHDPPATTFSANTTEPGAWVERKDSVSASRMTLDEVSASGVRFTNENRGRFGTGRATVELLLRQKGPSSTEVEYVLSGELSGVRRLLWSAVDLEERVGPDLERSLDQLEHACAR